MILTAPSTAKPQPVARMLPSIIGTAVLFGLLIAALNARWVPGQILFEISWFLPTTNSLATLATVAVAFLALERFHVLRDSSSYWIGVGFGAFALGNTFYLLSFPGLAPGGGSVIARLPNTSAWIGTANTGFLALLLLAAALARWPSGDSLSGRRWLLSVGACFGLVVLMGVLSVSYEEALPVLVDSRGASTPLSLYYAWILILLFGTGTLLSTRRYLQTGDSLLGYIALAQTGLFFNVVTGLLRVQRYDPWFYLSRILSVSGYIAVLFGLLSEYVSLFKRERGAAQKLAQSGNQFRSLYMVIATGVVVHGIDGSIIDANPTACDILGLSLDQLLGKTSLDPNWHAIHEDGSPFPGETHPATITLSTGKPVRDVVMGIYHPKSRAHRWVLVNSEPIQDERERVVRAVVTTFLDISHRKAAEAEREILLEQIREANSRLAVESIRSRDLAGQAQINLARWETTVNSMLDPVVLGDAQGRAVYMNPAAAATVGNTIRADVPMEQQAAHYHLYRPDGNLFPPEELPLQRSALRGEKLRDVEVAEGPPEGEQRLVLWNAAPLHDGTGCVVGSVAVGRDITAQRRAEQERSDLLRRIVTTQEDERRRLSRELHDETGQYLTVLMLGLRALRSSVQDQASSVDLIKRLEEIAGKLGQEVHRLAMDLRPVALDDLGLETTLQNYAEAWAERTGVEIDCQINSLGPSRLSSHIETAIYRLVQEALTNVAKHARASHVSLILRRRDNHVVAIVEDNGRGFDLDDVMHAEGPKRLGLRGIQDRVSLLDGTLEIESSPGGGTTLFVALPITLAEEAARNG